MTTPPVRHRGLRPLFLLLALGALLAAGLGSGCNSLDREYRAYKKLSKLKGIVSIVPFTEDQNAREAQTALEYRNGRLIYLYAMPLVTSRDITSIAKVKVPGGYALSCDLNSEGAFRWTKGSADFQGRYLALLIDNKFYAFLKVERAAQEPKVLLQGPFSEEEARVLTENAPKNFTTLQE